MSRHSPGNDALRRRSVLAGTFAGAAGLAAATGILPGTSAAAQAATTTSTEDGTTDWINVVSDYAADPTGAADSTSVIQDAIKACPVGGVVYFPAGSYTVSSPLLITNAGTRLLGSHSGNNGFEGGGSNAAIINAAAAFSGDAILDTNGQADFSARDLNVHGHNMTTGTTIGINVNGGALLEDVLVAYTVGTGIKIRNGVTVMHQVGVFHAGNSTGAGSGFDIDEADCWYTNCLSSGHATSGWAISGADNTTFTACRAEDGLLGSGAQGFVLTMTAMYGGISFNQCTTDLNDGDGFVIDGVTGNGCIQLNGCEFRRDGNNNADGGGGYSGIKVVNTTAPVVIDGTAVTARQGDHGGTDAPVYGLTMTGSAFVSVNGGYLSSAAGGRPVNWDGAGKLLVTPGLLTATVSGSAATLNLPAPSGNNASPQDQNLLAWSYDPVLQTGSSIPSAACYTDQGAGIPRVRRHQHPARSGDRRKRADQRRELGWPVHRQRRPDREDRGSIVGVGVIRPAHRRIDRRPVLPIPGLGVRGDPRERDDWARLWPRDRTGQRSRQRGPDRRRGPVRGQLLRPDGTSLLHHDEQQCVQRDDVLGSTQLTSAQGGYLRIPGSGGRPAPGGGRRPRGRGRVC